MQFEHFAINVPDSAAMADWYIEHCGMRSLITIDEPPFARYLADEKGRMCMEIYSNETAPIPDYPAAHVSTFHVAFAVDDVDATADRLVAAGATVVDLTSLPDGTRLGMLRDPWGVPLQLCCRATKLL